MKKTLFLCVFLVFGQILYAQQDSTQSKAPPKWEIGVDLLSLIDKNSLPNFSILIRKHNFYANDKTTAWRFRIGIDWAEHSPLSNFFSDMTILTRLGYEWHKVLSKNTHLYYGTDFHFLHKKRIVSQGSLYVISDLDNWEIGAIAVIGGRYFINKNLSLSIEGNLDAVFVSREDGWIQGGLIINGVPIPETYDGDRESKGFLFRISPVSTLNLSIHF